MGAEYLADDAEQLDALPSFGAWDDKGSHEPAPVDAEYGIARYFGVPIRVVLDPLSLELTFEEFMDLAATLDGEEDMRAFGAVRAFLRAMIHPADFNRFWALVKEHRQDVMKQMEFGKWLIEEVTGHPTVRLSGSDAGQPPTTPNSADDVSWRVQHRLEDQGRPDLALVVVRKREHDASVG